MTPEEVCIYHISATASDMKGLLEEVVSHECVLPKGLLSRIEFSLKEYEQLIEQGMLDELALV